MFPSPHERLPRVHLSSRHKSPGKSADIAPQYTAISDSRQCAASQNRRTASSPN
ncbi:hypothetical protein [Shewanella sp.]|uniref:hypothetical protein n=1 Tax=Shewanella sp. TaxID=50422 RepID=UPI003F677837